MKRLTKDEFVALLRTCCSTVNINGMMAEQAFDRIDKYYYIYDITVNHDHFMQAQILRDFKDKTNKFIFEVCIGYKSEWCPQDMPVDYLIIDGNDGSVYTWYSILESQGLWK